MSDSLTGLYQQVILDHARERHGDGTVAEPHAERFEHNPTCGDEITLQLAIADGRVQELAWRGTGCSISIASASVLSDLALGRTPAELTELIGSFRTMLRSRGDGDPDESLGDAVAFQGVSRYVMRVKCAMLAWIALEGCLAQIA